MSQKVDPTKIEGIVGIERHPTRHFGRAVSSEQVFYILHSADCLEERENLRTCPFSFALDRGAMPQFEGLEDRPVALRVRNGYLIPEVT